MVETLLEFDKVLFLFLNGLGSPSYDSFWLVITNKLLNAFIYFILALYFFKKTNLKYFFLLLLSISVLILFTDQFTNFIKHIASRPGPCYEANFLELIRLVKLNCGGAFGYFSGHASNSFALAFFFSRLLSSELKQLPIFLFLFAFLVSYSRIYIGVHYPLDVFSGAVMGSFSGLIGYLLWSKYLYSDQIEKK